MPFSCEMVFWVDVASYFLPLYNQKDLWIGVDMSRIAVDGVAIRVEPELS